MFALVLFGMVFGSGVVSAVTNINSCTIMSANTIYNLTGDVIPNLNDNPAYCMRFNGNNITLNGNGFSIRNSTYTEEIFYETVPRTDIYVNDLILEGVGYLLQGIGNNSIVDNVTFIGGSTQTRYLGDNNVTIKNCNFTEGVYVFNMNQNIDGLYLINNTFSNFDLVYQSTYITNNLLVEGNTFYNFSKGSIFNTALNLRGNYDNITIRNNVFDSLWEAIDGYSGIEGSNILIEDNIFYNNLSSFVTPLTIKSSPINLTIFNNTFYHNVSSQWIRVDNSTNLNISNNNFGTTTSKINTTSISASLVYIDGCNVGYINNNFLNASYSNGIRVLYENYNVINFTIGGNIFYSSDGGSNYMFGIGRETSNSYMSKNNLIQNNFFSGSENGGLHIIFLGFTQDSIAQNNTAIGGSYGYIIKGSQNPIVRNNFAYNNSINNYYDKGSSSAYFYNNYGFQPSGGSFLYSIQSAASDSTNSTNSTWINNIIEYTSGDTDPFHICVNQEFIIINASYDSNEEVVLGNLTRKWYLDASSNINNTKITITNSTGDIVYSDLTNSSIAQQTLLSYINEGGTQTNYSNYTITASASGYITNMTEINLTDNVNLNFTLTAITPTTTTTETSTSGGSPTYYPTETNLQEGYSKQLAKNWKLKFKVNNESHQLKLDNLDKINKTATVIVSSESQTKTLSVGEEWKVNLDGDGDYDLLVRLDNVTFSRAEVFIMEIDEVIEVDEDETFLDDGFEKVDENDYWLFCAVAVLVLIVGFLIWVFVKKRKN